MMRGAALLMAVLLAACYPAAAKSHHGHRHGPRTVNHASNSGERESRSGITCDMVRAYVAQVGMAQAAAMAQSAGITSSEKARAMRCLAEKS
jgi:hypothetical protein